MMAIGRDGWRMSQVAGLHRARLHLPALRSGGAGEIVDGQIETIENQWDEVCDLAGMAEGGAGRFCNRQFLNPYALEGYRLPRRAA